MGKDKIIEIINELQKLADKYGYVNIEIAKVIFDFCQSDFNDITESQVEQIKKYLNTDVEEIYDENVKIKIDMILNK